CPLCSSIRATPLKIMTTARRSVHTLIGSNEAFKTRTRAFIVRAILRERRRKCQKTVSEVGSAAIRACGSPASLPGHLKRNSSRMLANRRQDVGAPNEIHQSPQSTRWRFQVRELNGQHQG